MRSTVEAPDWSTIPAPVDDGVVRHLLGAQVPSMPLRATDGGTVDLSALRGRAVVYAYPRTGRPGVANPEGWDMIPGARGCTPQTCSFRDHFAELGPRRRPPVRPLHPRPRLPARSGGAPAPAVRHPVGRTPRADDGDGSAHLRDQRDDVPEARHPGARRRHGRARLLPGIPAGSECKRHD